jgi:glutamyl-tRNA synthetase
MIVTRFAPSPTGMIHIGSARTALFNYLYAKHTGGKYRLRIEDTDTQRNVEGGVEVIIKGFKWLGIEHDNEIVYQSKNIKRHQEIAQELLKKGKAYYCYTSKEELEEMRKEAETQGKVFKFKSPWREADPKIAPKDIKPVIRIKAPLTEGVTVYDTVQGAKTISGNDLDDFIILRNDGSPIYLLACAVDDYDMGITHIIRGNEHYYNAFRQKIIYDAMGWECPIFCHIPLILGKDKTKLSKRHGAPSIMDYKEMGYLPEAVNNHLLRLGWSHGDDEIFSAEQAIKWFDIKDVRKSPSVFDMDKLNSVNKFYIQKKTNQELFDLVKEKINPEYFEDKNFEKKCLQAIEMIKIRAIVINDIAKECEVYKNGYVAELDEKSKNVLGNKGGQEILRTLLEKMEQIGDWKTENIKEALKPIAEANNWKMALWTQALRVAVTFATVSSGGVFEIMEILGKEEALKRVAKVV